MKLWLLLPKNDLHPTESPWQREYYTVEGFVIRAKTKKKARKIASRAGRAEKEHHQQKAPWLDSNHSTCTEIKTDGEAKIILADWREG